MTKLNFLIVFISVFQLYFGQLDTSRNKGVIMRRTGLVVQVHCDTKIIKRKMYDHQVGETFDRTVLANGWFVRYKDSCYQNTWMSQMIEKEFYLGLNGVYRKYKKGKPYTGIVRENDGEYKIIGRCKKGRPVGKFKILNSKKELIWKGEIQRKQSE